MVHPDYQYTPEEVMDQGVVDLIVIVDDGSQDETTNIAPTLPNTKAYLHKKNLTTDPRHDLLSWQWSLRLSLRIKNLRGLYA